MASRKQSSATASGIGAPSLLMLLVVLAMTILAALTLLSARSDIRLSRRAALVAEQTYALYAEGEEQLAALDATVRACNRSAASEEGFFTELQENLHEGVHLDGNMLYFSVTDGVSVVSYALETEYGAETPLRMISRGVRTQENRTETEEEWN